MFSSSFNGEQKFGKKFSGFYTKVEAERGGVKAGAAQNLLNQPHFSSKSSHYMDTLHPVCFARERIMMGALVRSFLINERRVWEKRGTRCSKK